VVTILFAGDVNFFLAELVVTRRKSGRERGVFFLPSDALLSLWEVDLSFDVSLGGCFGGVAPVRRREDAERDRNSGVKVQVDDFSMQEADFSNAFRRAERKTRRGLLLLWG
jgi:hypothetical protein